MLFLTICFAPIIFIGWCYVKIIEFIVAFVSFELKCAAVKKKDPEQYRRMKQEAYRITNGRHSGYWTMRWSRK